METQGIPVCGIAANGCIEAVRERKWKCKESMLHRCQFPLEQTGGENQKPFFNVLKCINSCPADYRKCLTITNSYVTLKINYFNFRYAQNRNKVREKMLHQR